LHTFPIVAIGASAGGLDALAEFTASLDPSAKAAYIVIQHLEPSQPSILSELLATKTTLRVVEATDGAALEPQTMFVIPANAVMTMDEDRLLVSTASKSFSPPATIDRFFESLANEEGRNAIGVLLSGMGSDGAAGLKAIKNAGGLTFVQDEASAKFFAMPKAALDLGAADLALPPGSIAKDLSRLIEHPYYIRSASGADPSFNLDSEIENEGLIRQVLIELKVRTGIDFSLYKKGTIRRRLARRLALNGCTRLDEYLDLLKTSRDEGEILSRELLIQVTDFFRDPDVFEGLTKLVLPQLLSRQENSPIRIWVPGCATGEEVYSIAITMMESLGLPAVNQELQLFGTDLSDSAIETARAGVFPETISRHVSEERLHRFFVRTNGGYRIATSIRNMCVFARQNVVDDPPFSRIDLISCRNLLIYLDAPLQKKVMGLFNYSLRPGGFLVLGSSESIGTSSELFFPVDKRLRIFTKKVLPGKIQTTLFAPVDRFIQMPPSRKSLHATEQSESERLVREADRLAMLRYLPPGVLCDADLNILEYRGDTTPFIGNPIGPPNHNLHKLVRPGLLVELSNAVRTSGESSETILLKELRLNEASGPLTFSAEILPVALGPKPSNWFWIFFLEEDHQKQPSPLPRNGWFRRLLNSMENRLQSRHEAPDGNHEEIGRLKRELENARTYVRNILESHEATMEELNAAEEELLSSNEEFQSTNEELQTAQEELQSSNDELRSRNRELNTVNEELIQARDFAECIVETVCQPLIVLNGGMIIQRANPAFYKTFQLRPEQVEGLYFFDLGNGGWINASIKESLFGIIPEDQILENLELEVKNSILGDRVLRLNAQCLNWEHQRGILMLLEDITEQRNAIKKLQEMDQRKDEFMAMLAHELRNPLTPIRNALEIWKQGKAGPEEICQIQETMDRQLKHEARLIDDLIDLSRINRGAILLKRQVTDFRLITLEVIDDLRSLADSHHHEIITNISQDPVTVDADPIRLAQIVSNLISNAIKYTPDGGKLRIALVREGGHGMLSITDNGVGIDPSVIPSIFDMFVQADRPIARTEGGLGIGLTLVRRLVELHEGEVRAYSEGQGKGSCFTVRIPITNKRLDSDLPDTNPKMEETAIATTSPNSSSQRILIVDDNVDAAESLALLLTLKGFETKVAFDGEEAIRISETFLPEVVLLDIGLPILDGYQVAEKLRGMSILDSVLLIAISGYGQPNDVKKALSAGFDHHMTKPANVDLLLELISHRHGLG
jgi:two-component system, chemotaxis family, CheB/CheR fusion protein